MSDKFDEMARECVDGLFTNGGGEKADRLVLWRDTVDYYAPLPERNLGGWCRGAVVDRIAALVRREVEQARADERAVSRRAATEIHQDAVRRWCEQHRVDFPVLLLKISEHDERCAAIRARGEQHGTGEGQNHG